jgi:vacuolar-type H+-ATPase subunit C/Vma6
MKLAIIKDSGEILSSESIDGGISDWLEGMSSGDAWDLLAELVFEMDSKKQTHVFGHALCQACEEDRPESSSEHDKYADVCELRD